MYEKNVLLLADGADESFGATLTTEVRVGVDLGNCSHRVGVSTEGNNRRRPFHVRSSSRPDVINPDLPIGDQDLRLSESLVTSQSEWRLYKKLDQEIDITDSNQETYAFTCKTVGEVGYC